MAKDKSMLLDAMNTFQGKNILVVGDVMLDEFHWCQVSRISEEAPVPICKVDRTSYSPGGAANVAQNVQSLGGTAHLAGHIGDDGSAKNLLNALDAQNISQDCLVVDDTRATILKSRVIAQKQQVVRIDREKTQPIPEYLEYGLIQKIEAYLSKSHCIVLSDYGKGTLTDSLIKKMIADAKTTNIPILVDPKGGQYQKYKGAYAITPNFKEFQVAVSQKIESEQELHDLGYKMCQDLELELLIVTRSEKGVSIINKDNQKIDFPTLAQDVLDITGAGDTVIASLALGLAGGIEIEKIIKLANLAAGISVSKVGTVAVTAADLNTAIERGIR